LVRFVTVQVVAVVAAQVRPSGLAVTVYPVTGVPPVLEGAVHVITELLFAFDVAVTPVGAPGAAAGSTLADASDSAEAPDPFVAVTLKVYEVPFVRPVTAHANSPVVTQVLFPGVDVTV
jgi:hypothetical protein